MARSLAWLRIWRRHWAAACVLVLCASPAASSVFQSRDVALDIRHGVVRSLKNMLTGETLAEPAAGTVEESGLFGLREMLSCSAGVTRTTRLPGKSPTLLMRTTWPGKGSMACRLTTAQGGLRLQLSGHTQRAGLHSAAWTIGFVPERLQILVPGNSGQVFARGAPFETRIFDWPISWEASFALIQGARGGVLIYAEDPTLSPKQLIVQRVPGGFRLSFRNVNHAPFQGLSAISGKPWRITAYRGTWHVGAALYRKWAEATYGLRPLGAKRPAWAASIQFVVIVGMNTDALPALAQRTDPTKTLLYVPDWRRDGYDRNYPDYTARPGFRQFLDTAHRLGFRVMVHVNYFGCDPKNPEYERFRPYHMKEPFTGELLYWDWSYADPPIKFAYINPASKQWRALFVQRMKELCRTYPIDALHLDQTLCIFNDANGRIDGMSCAEGNLALHRELKAALPDVALSGEGLNEVTCRYEEFAQRHVWGVDHVQGTASDRYIAMAHPIASALLCPYTTMYGYLGMPNPTAEHLFRAYERAYDRFGVIPTLSWPTAAQLGEDMPALIEIVLSRARLFQTLQPRPDSSGAGSQGGAFVWRTYDGGWMRRVEANGSRLEVRRPGEAAYRIVERRISGVERVDGPGCIPGWLAYDDRGIVGLDPAATYYWLPREPDRQALHVSRVPSGWHLTRGGRDSDLFRVVVMSHGRGAHEIKLWEAYDLATVGVVPASGKPIVLKSPDLIDDASGGNVHPTGESLFMHPPWKGLPASGRPERMPTTWIEYRLELPDHPDIRFEAAVHLRKGADRSDGVRFRFTARAADDTATISAEVVAASEAKTPVAMDLTPLRGRKVVFRIEADAGEKGDPSFDWGLIHRPRIVMDPRLFPPATVTLELSGAPVPRVLPGRGSAEIVGRDGGRTTVRLELPNSFVVPAGEPYAVPDLPGGSDATRPLVRLMDLPLVSRTLSPPGIEGPPPPFAPGIAPATCGGDTRPAISLHPPQGGASLLDYHLRLPERPCRLRTAIGIRDGSRSSGVLFRVEVNGWELWSHEMQPGGGWVPVELDLSRYAGQEVVLTLVTDAMGPFDFDWAVWAEPVIVTAGEAR